MQQIVFVRIGRTFTYKLPSMAIITIELRITLHLNKLTTDGQYQYHVCTLGQVHVILMRNPMCNVTQC